MLVVSVESPPGGGKGFLLKYLSAKGLYPMHGRVALHDDAIHHIMDMNTDSSRWAFFTELFFLCTHVQCYQQAMANHGSKDTVLLLEGSPVTDKLCYYEKHHQSKMHPLEAQLYEEWYEKLKPLWRVDHHLLLLSDMHAHMERIIDNAKFEQAGIGLEDIHALTETYVKALPKAYVLPCPANFEDNEPVLENLRAVVIRLMQSLATASKLHVT